MNADDVQRRIGVQVRAATEQADRLKSDVLVVICKDVATDGDGRGRVALGNSELCARSDAWADRTERTVYEAWRKESPTGVWAMERVHLPQFDRLVSGHAGQSCAYMEGTVLVLGVGADETVAEARRRDVLLGTDPFTGEKLAAVIPVSRGHGNIDWLEAAAARMGVHLGRVGSLNGKQVQRLIAHSWGALEVLNALEAGDFRCIELHLMGSPSMDLGRLERLAQSGAVRHIYVHVNKGDRITWFRWLPHLLDNRMWGYVFTFGGETSITVLRYDLDSDEAGHPLKAYYHNIVARRPDPFGLAPASDAGGMKPEGEEDKDDEEKPALAPQGADDDDDDDDDDSYSPDPPDKGGGGAALRPATADDGHPRDPPDDDDDDDDEECGGVVALRPATAEPSSRPIPGGVLLDGTARIGNLDGVQIEGAVWNPEQQQLRLIVKGELVSLPRMYLDDFLAVLHTVYAGEEPGVSIDPGPTKNEMVVSYFGRVDGTRIGWTMFEADRLLKAYSLGRDNLTGYPISPPIPHFNNMIQWCEEKGLRYSGAMYRFWFVPSEIRLRRAGDAVVLDKATIVVKTEYMMTGLKGESEPAARAFALSFSENYHRFAQAEPVFRDLLEYAKLVGIAKYLKERGVPLNWLMFANSGCGRGFDTPQTTRGYTVPGEETGGLEIWGGVDLGTSSSYAPGWNTVPSLVGPVMASYSPPTSGHSSPALPVGFSTDGELACSTFQSQHVTYTSLDLPGRVKRRDGSQIVFQTDAVVSDDKGPVLELTRYYDPKHHGSDEFGDGWHLLVPLEVKAAGKGSVTFLNAEVPEKMLVVDRVAGRREVLTFGRDAQNAGGYFPQDASRWKGLYLMSNAALRLVDHWQDEFHFDPQGRLVVVDMGAENRWVYHYNDRRIVAVTTLPMGVAQGSSTTVDLGRIRLPAEMAVADRMNGTRLKLGQDAAGNIGYFPKEAGHWTGLFPSPDSTFRLQDRWGSTYYFDASGQFVGLSNAEVTDAAGAGRAIRFTRDESGRVVEAALGDDGAVLYWYGQHNRLAKVMRIDGSTRAYAYDWRGRLGDRPRGRLATGPAVWGGLLALVATLVLLTLKVTSGHRRSK